MTKAKCYDTPLRHGDVRLLPPITAYKRSARQPAVVIEWIWKKKKGERGEWLG